MIEQRSEVRPPLSEVVVGIDDRHTPVSGDSKERGYLFGGAERRRQKRRGALEVEVIDDVDEQNRKLTLVRCVAVKVGRALVGQVSPREADATCDPALCRVWIVAWSRTQRLEGRRGNEARACASGAGGVS